MGSVSPILAWFSFLIFIGGVGPLAWVRRWPTEHRERLENLNDRQDNSGEQREVGRRFGKATNYFCDSGNWVHLTLVKMSALSMDKLLQWMQHVDHENSVKNDSTPVIHYFLTPSSSHSPPIKIALETVALVRKDGDVSYLFDIWMLQDWVDCIQWFVNRYVHAWAFNCNQLTQLTCRSHSALGSPPYLFWRPSAVLAFVFFAMRVPRITWQLFQRSGTSRNVVAICRPGGCWHKSLTIQI